MDINEEKLIYKNMIDESENTIANLECKLIRAKIDYEVVVITKDNLQMNYFDRIIKEFEQDIKKEKVKAEILNKKINGSSDDNKADVSWSNK